MTDYKTNVSEIHLAQRCPRLLQRQRSGNRAAWRVGLEGSGQSYGSLFHNEIVGPFHRDASGEAHDTDRRKREKLIDILSMELSDAGALALELKAFMAQEYFIPFLLKRKDAISEGRFASIVGAVDCWMVFLADFLFPILVKTKEWNGGDRTVAQTLVAVFWPPEKDLFATHVFPDGKTMKIAGRFDAVLCDPNGGGVEIVDFKCRKATDPLEDLLQISLYAWLLLESTGVQARGRVLYFEETQREHTHAAETIRMVFRRFPSLFERIREIIDGREPPPGATNPDLCENCLFEQECREFTENPLSPPAATGPKRDEEAEAAMESLVKVLGQLNVPVIPDGYLCGPRFMRLRIKPETGVVFRKIAGCATDLQIGMHLNGLPLIQPRSGHVSVDISRKSPELQTLGMLLNHPGRPFPVTASSSGLFPLGAEIDGTPYWVDLASPGTPNILIGGTTGSGKSVLLQGIVLGLASTAARGAIRITLIDPKRVTFAAYDKLPVLDGSVIMDGEPALERLTELADEMEKRYRVFADAKVESLERFNELNPEKCLVRNVVIVDEYADMIGDKKIRPVMEALLKRIGQKGRAAGLHLVMATQQPTVSVVDTVIKSNLPLRIAMKVANHKNSEVIIDETGAECLFGHGDMLVRGISGTVRLQAPWVTSDDFERVRTIHS